MRQTLRELVESKRRKILEIANKHGAYHVRLFGSVARGEASAKSDIDLLVDLKHGRSLLDHAALLLDLENLLGRKVDVITERGLRRKIWRQVKKEAILL